MPAPPFKPTSTTPPVSVPLSYTANCSITLSAALAATVAVSTVRPDNCCSFQPVPAATSSDPSLATLCKDTYTWAEPLLGLAIRRSYSYVTLALYRLLRYLIPPTDAVVAAAASEPTATTESSSGPPTSLDPAWYDTMQRSHATARTRGRARITGAVLPASVQLQMYACRGEPHSGEQERRCRVDQRHSRRLTASSSRCWLWTPPLTTSCSCRRGSGGWSAVPTCGRRLAGCCA